ncbi:hypothetical protein GDO81_016939 [Engystomops pustulosus]|uniref:Uncharacterized protein n=1 Tax=Engystomops pustulosus TaxID=76066 RepID=A0AAV7ADT9_ENGPU|nr:hypothetical protein GDO81_016939 [Engystomops pustulosus]
MLKKCSNTSTHYTDVKSQKKNHTLVHHVLPLTDPAVATNMWLRRVLDDLPQNCCVLLHRLGLKDMYRQIYRQWTAVTYLVLVYSRGWNYFLLSPTMLALLIYMQMSWRFSPEHRQ